MLHVTRNQYLHNENIFDCVKCVYIVCDALRPNKCHFRMFVHDEWMLYMNFECFAYLQLDYCLYYCCSRCYVSLCILLRFFAHSVFLDLVLFFRQFRLDRWKDAMRIRDGFWFYRKAFYFLRFFFLLATIQTLECVNIAMIFYFSFQHDALAIKMSVKSYLNNSQQFSFMCIGEYASVWFICICVSIRARVCIYWVDMLIVLLDRLYWIESTSPISIQIIVIPLSKFETMQMNQNKYLVRLYYKIFY